MYCPGVSGLLATCHAVHNTPLTVRMDDGVSRSVGRLEILNHTFDNPPRLIVRSAQPQPPDLVVAQITRDDLFIMHNHLMHVRRVQPWVGGGGIRREEGVLRDRLGLEEPAGARVEGEGREGPNVFSVLR